MNVSEQIIQIFKNVGVTQIWGVTGDALNTFTDALRNDNDIKWNTVRHEENVAFAAGASCRNSREEVLALSEKLKAPIVHTLRS